MGRELKRAESERPVTRFVARGLAVFLVLSVAGGWALVRYWTDPVTVRRLVLEQLRHAFPGADVSLDSARLWPGWGIRLTNLTLARKDDPTLTPVLQVPAGRIEHDAEALAKGELRVRRLKLERPRLTAVRAADGKWNTDGLLAPPKPGTPLPIVVVEHGTLVLRLTPPGGGESVWEVGGLRASLLEDRPGEARFEGRGESGRLGRMLCEGLWRRENGHVDAAFDLTGLPLGLDLLRELARFAPVPVDQLRHCNGEARVHLNVRRRPEEAAGWQPDWRVNVTRGRLGLRDLPTDFDAVDVVARIRDGRLMIKEAHALAGDAPVHAFLEAKLPADSPAAAVESLAVSAERLLITPELFTRMPEKLQKFQQRFAPVGRVGVVYRFAKRRSGGWDARLELKPDGLAARYHKFPYPMRNVRGSVITEMSDEGPSRNVVDITSEVNGGARFAIRGTVAGAEPHPAVDLWISGTDGRWGRNLPADEDIITALPPKFQPLARSFRLRGHVDLVARIHHAEGQAHGHDQYHVRCRDAVIDYEAFPVPLQNVAAELEIHLGPGLVGDANASGDHWLLRSFSGTHGTGQITATAHNEPLPVGQKLVIELAGLRMPLGDALKKALGVYKLTNVWELMAPSGVTDFSSRVTLTDAPDRPKEPAVTLGARGATLRPGFFPYELTDASVHLHAEPGRVLLGECGARHGSAALRIKGGEVLTTRGVWVDVRDLRAGPLTPDAELLRALPPTLRKAGEALQPTGAIAVSAARLVFNDPPAIPGPPGPPVLYWDGAMTLGGFGMKTGVAWTDVNGTIACQGTVKGNRLEWLAGHVALPQAAVLGQPMEQFHAQLAVDPETPDVLQVRGLAGSMYGGRVTGEARVAFGGGLDYALDVKALGARLEEFGRRNGIAAGRLEGPVSAQLYLTGRGAGLAELTGRGDVDVASGKLYDLPVFLELLKAISLRAPDGVAFDEAHASFRLEGPRVNVERLDLLGNAVSLGGRGTLNLDGSAVALDFYAVWARIAQVLPTGWRDLPPWVSGQLLKIKMRGTLSQPSFAPEPVPFIVEPVQALVERVRRRTGE